MSYGTLLCPTVPYCTLLCPTVPCDAVTYLCRIDSTSMPGPLPLPLPGQVHLQADSSLPPSRLPSRPNRPPTRSDVEGTTDGWDAPTAYGWTESVVDAPMGWGSAAFSHRSTAYNSGLWFIQQVSCTQAAPVSQAGTVGLHRWSFLGMFARRA